MFFKEIGNIPMQKKTEATFQLNIQKHLNS